MSREFLPPNSEATVTIIGGGPAGITHGLDLLAADERMHNGKLHMVDPKLAASEELQPGDFSLYPNVPGNTAASDYLKAMAPYLERATGAPPFAIESLDSDETCPIGLLSQPLGWVAVHELTPRISLHTGTVNEIGLTPDGWEVRFQQGSAPSEALVSEAVVLATGGRPKQLDGLEISRETKHKLVSLADVLDPTIAQQVIEPADKLAVLGSSHSGILALMNIDNFPPEKMPQHITVYHKSGLRLASKDEAGNKYYDNTGLKGKPRAWAESNVATDDSGGIYLKANSPLSERTTFVHVDNDDDLAIELEKDGMLTKIIDARGLLPNEKPDIVTPSLGRVSSAEIARFGASDTENLPGLFCIGALAPRIVNELTADGSTLRAGNVGVTKFTADSRHVVVPQILDYIHRRTA